MNKNDYYHLLLGNAIDAYFESAVMPRETLLEVKRRAEDKANTAKTEFERLTWKEIVSIVDRHCHLP